MYLQDDLKNTFFAQYQIVQGKTAFCKGFLQEIPCFPHLTADARNTFIRCQF